MAVRLWEEIPAQHRATRELLESLNDPIWTWDRPWSGCAIERYLGEDEYAERQCRAVYKAIHCNWDSGWVSRDPAAPPDVRFTTQGYYKRYVRCPLETYNGASLCRRHGGPKRQVFTPLDPPRITVLVPPLGEFASHEEAGAAVAAWQRAHLPKP